MQKVIGRLVDPDSWFEIMPDFAPNMLVGFARLEGLVIGIIANQPMVKAGCIDIDSSDKAARFIRVCNIYTIPVLSLVDVPGFMPGLAQERGGIIRHGAKMLFAWASGTVPKITLICRKAYGGAYLAMCSSDMGADFVFAWPTAEIAVMGAQGAMKVLYKKELDEAEDPEALEKELRAAYTEKFASPYQAACQRHDHRRHRSRRLAQHPRPRLPRHHGQTRNPPAEETRQHPALTITMHLIPILAVATEAARLRHGCRCPTSLGMLMVHASPWPSSGASARSPPSSSRPSCRSPPPRRPPRPPRPPHRRPAATPRGIAAGNRRRHRRRRRHRHRRAHRIVSIKRQSTSWEKAGRQSVLTSHRSANKPSSHGTSPHHR